MNRDGKGYLRYTIGYSFSFIYAERKYFSFTCNIHKTTVVFQTVNNLRQVETQYQNIHQDLVERCRKGDTKAQFELYKIYYKPMYNICLRMVGAQVEAEDVMQEAFLNAFTKIDTYLGVVSFGAWLKKIVINRSLDHLKKRKVKFEELNEKIPDEEPVSIEISEIQMEKLKNAIQQLPDGYRVVLSLYLLEGYDHEEIAQILGITNVSSRSQYMRAKLKLREMLHREELFEYN
ncbi:MAG: sigma-70 family RNA polymerase sigma factor [Prolixibacteraceae bacterium]|nr:sigma-70 family RNA polymerase sigma factor [Prolixibacteraceae bacterium]